MKDNIKEPVRKEKRSLDYYLFYSVIGAFALAQLSITIASIIYIYKTLT